MKNLTIPLDRNNAQVKAAEGAETRLLSHYKLNANVHYVELAEPKMRVRVLEIGSGSPVIMIPGGAGDAYSYAPLIAELTGWKIIAINRPGGGMSDGIDHRTVDFRRFVVSALTTVLDAFNLPSVPVICNSMGGLWGFMLALDQPDRVSAMVQLGTPALILNTSAPFFMRLMSVPGLNRLMLATLMLPKDMEQARYGLKFLGESPEVCAALPDELVECSYWFPRLPTFKTAWRSLMERALTLRGAKPDLQLGVDQLSAIRQPVMFIWGNTDPFGTLDVARRACQAIPQATLHAIPAGHLPWLDDPGGCGRIIRDFLPEKAGAQNIPMDIARRTILEIDETT